MKSRSIILAILFTLLALPLSAQKMVSGYLFPAGGQVGTTVEVEAGGLNINKAKKVVFNHPGIKGEILPYEEPAAKRRRRRRLNDQSSPQLADKVKMLITIADDVPCGLYDLRLQSPKGLSNKLPFEVASYPNYLEEKKNSSIKNPNKVESLPAVLCGYVKPGEVDYFRFSGKKGDKLVASVKGRQLVPYMADAVPGWFQPVIRILDSKGREVAYSDDYHHNVDPVIMTTLPADDDYTLYIHDAIYRGREDFNYRIQLGVIPFVTGRYPAYGVAGKKVKQELEGVNLTDDKATIKVKNEGYHQLTYTNKTGTSNAVSYYALPKGTRLVHNPKDEVYLTFSNAIVDSLTAAQPIKRYSIDVERGEEVIVELIGRRNSSRIDAIMRLRDSHGNMVAEVDDTEDPIQGLITFHADPVLKYRAKAGGTMTLEVEDLYQGYGKDYHYVLRRHSQMPSFSAFVSPAYITIPSGGTSQFRVDITGKLKRPANLVLRGLPGGYTTSSMKVRGRRWDVSITAPKGAPIKRYPIKLKIEYPSNDGREMADVLPVDKMLQAFYYTHHIPAAELAVDVVEAAPYRLTLDMDLEQDVLMKINDETIPVKVMIDRSQGFTENVDLVLGKKNRLFELEPVSFKPGDTEKMVFIKVNQTAMERFKGKKNKPNWQMYISGIVKGEWIRTNRGRQVQVAKYEEMTPIFNIRLKR